MVQVIVHILVSNTYSHVDLFQLLWRLALGYELSCDNDVFGPSACALDITLAHESLSTHQLLQLIVAVGDKVLLIPLAILSYIYFFFP